MIQFNSDNLIVGEIKQKLKSFNLPQAKVWKDGMPIFSGCFYIKDNNLYQGIAGVGGNNTLQLIGRYIYGQAIPNLSKNLLINNLLYDSYTHKYLGDYLRFYRDMKDINLMSMYNCFSNELCKNLRITGVNYSFDTTNDKFKIYMIPIKWFEKYTIGIDCNTQVELIAGIYDNGTLVQPAFESTDITFYNNTYKKVCGTRFNKPFLYTKISTLIPTKRLYVQEPNLKLFIKVPASSQSSIVVLEGDYTLAGQLHFESTGTTTTRRAPIEVCNFETTKIDNFIYEGASFARRYLSRLQLLDFNSGINYPFADRLIEYLFNNVITADDEIAKNITRVQQRLIQRFNEYLVDSAGNYQYLLNQAGEYMLSDGTSISILAFNNLPPTDPRRRLRIKIHKYLGVSSVIKHDSQWSTHLRNVCYDIMLSAGLGSKFNTNKFDLIGFIDKDTERVLGDLTGGN